MNGGCADGYCTSVDSDTGARSEGERRGSDVGFDVYEGWIPALIGAAPAGLYLPGAEGERIKFVFLLL